MRGEEGSPVPMMLWAVFVFVMAVAGLVVWFLYISSVGQSECWRSTLAELRPVAGAFEVESLGVGKLLGMQDFTLRLGMRPCVSEVLFADWGACLNACRGGEKFEPDPEKCVQECAWCKGAAGCIIAVPATYKIGDIFKEDVGLGGYLKMLRANIKTYTSVDYGFLGDTVFAQEAGAQCLDFSLSEKTYTINSEPASKGCTVTEVGI